jgi:hypothetical protein
MTIPVKLVILVPLLFLGGVQQAQEPMLSRREFEARINDIDRRITQRFDLNDRATTIAFADMNRRLDAMNEFRATLSDQNKTFVTRSEWDGRATALDEKVRQLELTSSATAGASSRTVLMMGGFITVLNVILTVGLALWRDRRMVRNGQKL